MIKLAKFQQLYDRKVFLVASTIDISSFRGKSDLPQVVGNLAKCICVKGNGS